MELRYLAPFFQNLSTLLSFGCNVVRVLPLKLKKTARGGLDQDFHGPTAGRVSVLLFAASVLPKLMACLQTVLYDDKESIGCAPWLSLIFLRVQGVTYGA